MNETTIQTADYFAFDPNNTSLNRANAYWMAKFCEISYWNTTPESNQPDIQALTQLLKPHGFIKVRGANKNSAQGIYIEHADYCAIAFRGTDEFFLDWQDNLTLLPQSTILGYVHKGFYDSFWDVWDYLYKHYCELNNRYEDEEKPLFITGHSLGGAMATIAAVELISHDLPFANIYTFGQPRAVSREVARIINQERPGQIFRFTNDEDIVTRVPFRTMGYSHTGQSVFIDKNGKIKTDVGYWMRFLNRMRSRIDSIGNGELDMFEDHKITAYLKHIEQASDWL